MNQTIILPKGRTAAHRVCAFLEGLPLDKAWEVTVREHKRKRSDQQNAALWGLAYKTLSEFMGLRGSEEIEVLHETICRLYFGEVKHEVLGATVTRPKRTTTTDETGKRSVLTIPEFMDFFAFVQQRASSVGCFIPDPDPEWFMKDEAA